MPTHSIYGQYQNPPKKFNIRSHNRFCRFPDHLHLINFMKPIVHLTITAAAVLFAASSSFAAMRNPPHSCLSGTIICVDPGHPSETSAGTETNDHKLTERHVNWVEALLLKKLLEHDGARVVLTKAAEKQFVTNRHRAEIANQAHADLFLRLHCDYASEEGFATFYPNRTGTVQGHTGPSKRILRLSYADALLFQKAAINALNGKLNDRGARGESRTSVGAKQGALTGSIFSNVPALTVEMCVLNQPHDVKFIRSHNGPNELARSLEAGTVAVFCRTAKPVE